MRINPAIVLGDNGAVMAFLERTLSPTFAVVTAEERADGWAVRSPSTAFEGAAYRPHIAIGPSGEAVVGWSHSIDGTSHAFRATRDAIGRWFDPRTAIDAPHYPHETFSADVEIGSDGEVLHTWIETHDDYTGVGLERRAPGTDTFERLEGVLSPPKLFANQPRLVRNSAGDALLVWFQSVGGALMVFASERCGVDGEFSRPDNNAFLSPQGAPVDGPVPAITEDGTAVVAWRQETPSGMAVFLAERSQNQWTMPADLDATFSKPVEFVSDVRAAFVNGHLYVVWYERVGTDRAIYLAHRAADGAWVAKGTAPLRLSTDDAFDPRLAVGAHGEVIVTWTEDTGSAHRIVSRHSAADAFAEIEADRWGPRVVHSSETLGNAGNADAAIAASGDRAMITWEQAGTIQLATLH